MKIHTTRFFIWVSICVTFLVSCGGGGGSGGTSAASGGGSPTNNTNSVLAGSVIYLPESAPNSASILIYNDTSHLLNLTTANSNNHSIYPGSTSPNNPTDITACKTINAGGDCPVRITNNPAPQNMTLSLDFTDNKDHAYQTNQSIIYTGEGSNYENFYILGISDNNISTYVAPKSITQTTITFLLKANFEPGSVKITPDNSYVKSSTVMCSGYNSGGICTTNLIVDNTNDDIKSDGQTTVDLNISGRRLAGSQNFSPITQNNSLSLTINVTTNPNLVINPSNILINPANGIVAQLVTVTNNGNESAVLGQITPATPLIIESSTCTNNLSLGVGASCSFYVKATSLTSGNANILVPYFDPAGLQMPNGVINVTYIGTSPGPAQSMVIGNGSLTNTIVNGSSTVNVLVTNTGTTALNSINFSSDKPGSITFGSFGSSSSCKTDGTQSLPAGNSCTLTVIYRPTVVESGILHISDQATYIDGNGNPQTLPGGPVSINYSAVNSLGLLTINPSNVNLSIRANGVESITQSFILTNNGGVAATITAESIPVGLVKISDSCLNTTLQPAGTCTINTSFGPVSSTINSSSNLTVNYVPISGGQPVFAYSAVTLAASTAALVQITNVTESGIFSGSNNTFAFTNTPLSPFVVNITYTNSGFSPATNFTTQGALPYGWYLNTANTTCPYNSATGTLNNGSSCVLSVAAIESRAILNGMPAYNYAGILNLNLPGFSYQDSSGVNTVSNPNYSFGNQMNITSALLANVSESITTVSGSGYANAHVFTSRFTLSGTPAAGQLPITIRSNIPTSGNIYASPNTCTITVANGNCTITINSVAYTALGTYKYNYIVSPNGSTNGILKYFSFVIQ